MTVDVVVPSLDNFKTTVALVFGGDAAPFSIERLKALGWDGDDIRKLDGLGSKEADLELRYEEYQGRSRLRAEIRTTSTFKMKDENLMKTDDAANFANDVAQLMKTGKVPARMKGDRRD